MFAYALIHMCLPQRLSALFSIPCSLLPLPLPPFPDSSQGRRVGPVLEKMAHMMKWDGDSKHAVNIHFGKVNETRQALVYLDDLNLDDVLKSVLIATLKAPANRTLRDAYHNILDDLDDDKELTFALMQQACARQFRRIPDRERRQDTPRSDRATPRTSPDKPDIKYLRQGAHTPSELVL